MIELSEEQKRRWGDRTGGDPDVLERVMTAFGHLLRGDTGLYHHHMGMAKTHHTFGRAFEGWGESLDLAVAGCIHEIARRWECDYVVCVSRLGALERGDLEPPLHLFEDTA